MKKYRLVLALLCCAVVATGCASRSKLVAGPFGVGGSTAAHANAGFGFTSDWSETCVTLGYVTVCGNWERTDCTKLVSVEHVTGNTATVQESDVAKFSAGDQ